MPAALTEVLSEAEAFARRFAGSAHAELVREAFDDLRDEGRHDRLRTYVHLPLLLYAALTGDERPARRVAVLCTLVYVGAGALDDVADGEVSRNWPGRQSDEVQLFGSFMLAVLPLSVVGMLDASVETRSLMYEALVSGFAEMYRGQMQDLDMARADVADPHVVEASVAAKGGGEIAMFAALTALCAGADAAVVARCTDFGRAAGTAAQIASDCVDLFRSPHSSDLSSGTRSLPIARYLHGLRPTDRKRFLQQLHEARTDVHSAAAVRRELLDSGVLRYCGFVAGSYVRQALDALESVARFAEPGDRLHRWIESYAFARARSSSAA